MRLKETHSKSGVDKQSSIKAAPELCSAKGFHVTRARHLLWLI